MPPLVARLSPLLDGVALRTLSADRAGAHSRAVPAAQTRGGAESKHPLSESERQSPAVRARTHWVARYTRRFPLLTAAGDPGGTEVLAGGAPLGNAS